GPLPAAGPGPPRSARHPDHHPEDTMNRIRTRAAAAAPADPAPTPAVLQVTGTHVRLGDGYAATYTVCGYPAQVRPARLAPPPPPPPPTLAPARAAPPVPPRPPPPRHPPRRIDAARGRLAAPLVNAAAADAADLADRVARGASKLHHGGVYVTVHGRTLDELH